MKKYLDYAGLQRFFNGLKNLFVQKEVGKGLSSNDYTTPEKTKLANLTEGAEPNVIEVIKKNGTILPINSKEVDIAVPTKVSDLVNDSAFQTESQVDAKISAIQKMKKEVVTSLPTAGAEDIIYLTPATNGAGDNIMNEYMWINNKWEKIGDTATTLNVESITDSEIDAILAS